MLTLNLPRCQEFPSHITDFDILIIYQRIQITLARTALSSLSLIVIYHHYCNVEFVLFHNVSCYNDSLLSCIHVITADLLNITCTFGCHRHDIKEVRVYIYSVQSNNNLRVLSIYIRVLSYCDHLKSTRISTLEMRDIHELQKF